MPTYDYKCSKCETVKEVFHKITEDPEVICECGEKMKRGIGGGTGYIIRGGGTRNRTPRQRHGKKITGNQPTPTESAQEKAKKKAENISKKKQKYDSSNPYADL